MYSGANEQNDWKKQYFSHAVINFCEATMILPLQDAADKKYYAIYRKGINHCLTLNKIRQYDLSSNFAIHLK
jgi:hypothetical protein